MGGRVLLISPSDTETQGYKTWKELGRMAPGPRDPIVTSGEGPGGGAPEQRPEPRPHLHVNAMHVKRVKGSNRKQMPRKSIPLPTWPPPTPSALVPHAAAGSGTAKCRLHYVKGPGTHAPARAGTILPTYPSARGVSIRLPLLQRSRKASLPPHLALSSPHKGTGWNEDGKEDGGAPFSGEKHKDKPVGTRVLLGSTHIPTTCKQPSTDASPARV